MSRAVSNGVVQYLSPSAITKAAEDQEGCLRKWWFRYVKDLPEKGTFAQDLGRKVHKEIEDYLRTGVEKFSPLTLPLKPYFPARDENLLSIESKLDKGFQIANVRADESYIDFIRREGPTTIEVGDWKTTSNFKWSKRPGDLINTVQMPMYAAYVLWKWPDTTHVRLSHYYALTKGRPEARRVTEIWPAEIIRKRFAAISIVAESMVEAAGYSDPKQVSWNRRSCEIFGGCAYKTICPNAPGLFEIVPDGPEETITLFDKLLASLNKKG